MDIQRVRNLTTSRLHTDIRFLYEDLCFITGINCLMTHELPNAMRAVLPWLIDHIPDPAFWDNEYNPLHIGEIELPVPSELERQAIVERFNSQPDPLLGKCVIGVIVD